VLTEEGGAGASVTGAEHGGGPGRVSDESGGQSTEGMRSFLGRCSRSWVHGCPLPPPQPWAMRAQRELKNQRLQVAGRKTRPRLQQPGLRCFQHSCVHRPPPLRSARPQRASTTAATPSTQQQQAQDCWARILAYLGHHVLGDRDNGGQGEGRGVLLVQCPAGVL